MKTEVTTPDEFMETSWVTSGLNARKSLARNSGEFLTVIVAEIPLAELFGIRDDT